MQDNPITEVLETINKVTKLRQIVSRYIRTSEDPFTRIT